ncbi:MAG TPA: ATP-binding protein, partial [Roseiflexaceae bacterium]|nr:ATP-binding protein [Roseiflexaceae bacterium]
TGRLDQLPAYEHVKRAIEVALAGNHRLTLVSVGAADDIAYLAAWVRAQGGEVAQIDPCPCGYFGDPERACTCGPRDIVIWHRRPAWRIAMTADIVIEVPRPAPDRLLGTRTGERDEAILERIAEAQKRLPSIAEPVTLDAAGQSLMRAAARQLALTAYRVNRMLAVARTIAALSLSDRVGAAHLAESIQYRPRS